MMKVAGGPAIAQLQSNYMYTKHKTEMTGGEL